MPVIWAKSTLESSVKAYLRPVSPHFRIDISHQWQRVRTTPTGHLGRIVGSLSAVLVLLLASRTINFSFENPNPLFVGISIVALALAGRAVTGMAWLWWLWGAFSLAWSLAPGATHVTSLWEVTYVALFAAAWWRPAFWLAAIYVAGNGLLDQLSLNAFGLQQYMSGSVHYVAGGLAIVLVPVALVLGFRSITWRAQTLWGLSAGTATYGALISGARAVYLPLVIVLLAAAIRIIWERRSSAKSVAVVLTSALALIVALESVQPYRPMLTALGQKASIERQVESIGQRSNFAQRLRFIDQTLDIALTHPLGSGIGTYQAVINNYQKYPMVWSGSPHNYYVETAATGGWPRLFLLLLMIGLPLWRAWASKAWPWALGAAGIWATVAFDVTSYYPSYMMFAFLALGAAHWSASEARSTIDQKQEMTRVRWIVPTVSTFGIMVTVGFAGWWFWPCEGARCLIERYHGAEYLAAKFLETASESEREAAFTQLRSLYPESIWVLRMEQRYLSGPHSRLYLASEIAQRFPLQSPFNYLDWAQSALAVGDHEEAHLAIRRGLEVFGPDSYPYGEFRMTRQMYAEWLGQAEAILAHTGIN